MSPPPLFWQFLAFLLLNYHIIYLSSITSFPFLLLLFFYVLMKMLSIKLLSNFLELESKFFLCYSFLWLSQPFLFLYLSTVSILSQALALIFCMLFFPMFPLFYLYFHFLCQRTQSLHASVMLRSCGAMNLQDSQYFLLSFFTDDGQVLQE